MLYIYPENSRISQKFANKNGLIKRCIVKKVKVLGIRIGIY